MTCWARCLFQAYASNEVILSGGAINSPQLLMLSGVGNADDLKKLGIPVVCHLPGEFPSPLLLEGVSAKQNGLLYCVSVDWGGDRSRCFSELSHFSHEPEGPPGTPPAPQVFGLLSSCPWPSCPTERRGPVAGSICP